MASTPYTCRFCGESGRHTTSDQGVAPAARPSCCDKEACMAQEAEEAAAVALAEAEAEVEAAQARLDALEPPKRGRSKKAAADEAEDEPEKAKA